MNKPSKEACEAAAVEVGVEWGWMHAHKHVDDPSEQLIKEAIVRDVVNEISERFRFGEDG